MSGTTVLCVYISQQAQQWHNPRLHKQQPRNSNTTKYFVKYARNLLLLKVETTNLFCHLRQKYKVEYNQAMTANDTTWHHSSTCYLHSMRQEEQTVEEKKKLREKKVFRKRQRAVQGRFDCCKSGTTYSTFMDWQKTTCACRKKISVLLICFFTEHQSIFSWQAKTLALQSQLVNRLAKSLTCSGKRVLS